MTNVLDDIVQEELDEMTNNDPPSNDQVVEISPMIRFPYNSINVVIGKIGSGKSCFVYSEAFKLHLLNEFNPDLPRNAGYSTIIHCSNQKGDKTFMKWKPKLQKHMIVVECSYEQLDDVLDHIKERKLAYQEVKEHNLEKRLTKDSRKDILVPLGVSNFRADVIHTLIICEDAMRQIKTKTTLLQRLMANRHGNFTFEIIIQDPLGIPTEIKTNLHTLTLFGGFSRQKIRYLLNMIPNISDVEAIWNQYTDLTEHDYMYMVFNGGFRLEIVKRKHMSNNSNNRKFWAEYEEDIELM
jgi:hypothetical protein